jgi:Uma2 family endonuclease
MHVAADIPGARRRFTADEVLRMVELGLLQDGPNVELLEGELVVVDAQGPVHSSLTVDLRRALERAYGDDHHVRDHSSVRAGPDSLPEPDIAVVRGPPRAYRKRLPGPKDIVLVVEVSHSSLRRDRRKADIYAAAGYAAYWLVDVDARRLELRTKPQKDGVYAKVEILDEDATVTAPGTKASLRVAALLP